MATSNKADKFFDAEAMDPANKDYANSESSNTGDFIHGCLWKQASKWHAKISECAKSNLVLVKPMILLMKSKAGRYVL